MGDILEVQIISHGFNGAPGYTNLYFDNSAGHDPDLAFEKVHDFLTVWQQVTPTLWSAEIRPTGRVLLDSSGALQSFVDCPTLYQATVTGSDGGGFGAGVAGMVVGWQTGTINRARQVRGRTFLVPLSAAAWQSDGTISTYELALMNGAASALVASAADLIVWSRPRGGTGGVAAPVTGHRINDRAAFLTSRRQ